MKKAFVAQYFAHIWIVKNRLLISFFVMKTKLMKCYTARCIKISIPKCYLSYVFETRTSALIF